MNIYDKLGAWKVRWKIGRMSYKIKPGLYGVGHPDKDSPVLVSANYKLSFDVLRKELTGLDAWIMVIDTNGINVWCAAGEGTFGTREIIKSIKQTKLLSIVSHRELILPQLGAPGVEGHIVTKATGFKIIYGPVRAEDIMNFIKDGMKADERMRTVFFTIKDRIILTPVEIVGSLKLLLAIMIVLFALNIISERGSGIEFILKYTMLNFFPYLGSVLMGCIVVPVLLPYIPGRAFSWKGWCVGLLWALIVILNPDFFNYPKEDLLFAASYLLLLPSISAYLAMNFTGCTTYTSLSGVKKEIGIALPLIAVSCIFGVILILVRMFMVFKV